MLRNELTGSLDVAMPEFDIVIIGGGATGLGIALDASLRDYSVLLIEKGDFASGTSSRSTKLVHGGVRYLAKGDILLVREALKERGIMLRNAPHLTDIQEFLIPVYTWWDAMLYTLGLGFYDLLSGRYSLGRSSFIGPSEVRKRLPLIRSRGLKGGILYHDGRFDDARYALELARAAVDQGATVLNYFSLSGFIKNDAGKILGIYCKDQAGGREYKVLSKLVINAGGVFSDEIRMMDQPGCRPGIRPSRGVHVVLDRSFLRGNTALMIPKTSDGRVLFLIPWYDRVIAGTTDTPVDRPENEPRASDEEIRFILKTAGMYLEKPPEITDVKSVFAGLRPLAAQQGRKGQTKEFSRRHRISWSPSGLLSVTGGKWTTYRLMAKETLEMAIRKGYLYKKACKTRNFKLSEGQAGNDRLKVYGKGREEILELMKSTGENSKQLHPAFPYTAAEMRWICRNEMPCTLSDILARRTRALVLDAAMSMKLAAPVAGLMAEEMGKDAEWIDGELKKYSEIAAMAGMGNNAF